MYGESTPIYSDVNIGSSSSYDGSDECQRKLQKEFSQIHGAYASSASSASLRSMNSSPAQFLTPRNMAMYDPMNQLGMWAESFKTAVSPNAAASMLMGMDNNLDNKSEDTSQETLAPSNKYEQEATKPTDKIQRRLAQNREAARKSRLRKKAYVQQLESSRLKLMQLEQELERARQQGLYMGGGFEGGQFGVSGPVNPGIATFEMEYVRWVEEQNRQITELRLALNAPISDVELRILVEGSMKHYYELFQMKSNAAKADVFYVMSGMWKTSSERFFLWIGGFRPSELLKVLHSQFDLLTENQLEDISNLRQSCQQAEDALSQGMDKLQHTLSAIIAGEQLGEGNYGPQITNAMDKFADLVGFVNQADHLCQETLQQMYRILTTRQAARGLIALGEYFQRLRALSQLWANRPHEPA